MSQLTENNSSLLPTLVLALFAVSFGLAHNAFADQVVSTIQLPTLGSDTPILAAVNPLTNMVYIGGSNNADSIYVVNGTDSSASSVQIGTGDINNPGIFNVAVNPDTNMVYVGDGDDVSGLTILNGSNNSIVAKLFGSDGIVQVSVNPVTNRVYVMDDVDPYIFILNGSSNSVIGKIPGVGHFAINPATNKIYMDSFDSVKVIDGSTGTVTASIKVGPIVNGIGIDQSTNRIYVSDTDGLTTFTNPHMVVIDGSTDTIIATIPKLFAATDPAVNPTTNKIYLPYNDTSVAVINGSSNTVESIIPAGSEPYTAGANPITNMVYVVNTGDNTVSVIQGATPTEAAKGLINTINGMNLPQGITTSLDAKIDAAIGYLNSGDKANATSSLDAVINEVKAKSGKELTTIQAGHLVASAQAIIRSLL